MIFDILCVVAIATLFAIGAEAWTKMLLNVEALKAGDEAKEAFNKLGDFLKVELEKEITKKNDKRKRK